MTNAFWKQDHHVTFVCLQLCDVLWMLLHRQYCSSITLHNCTAPQIISIWLFDETMNATNWQLQGNLHHLPTSFGATVPETAITCKYSPSFGLDFLHLGDWNPVLESESLAEVLATYMHPPVEYTYPIIPMYRLRPHLQQVFPTQHYLHRHHQHSSQPIVSWLTVNFIVSLYCI